MMTGNIFDFKLFFTEEAFEIIQSHLTNLGAFMAKYGVNQSQKESVLEGIYEYINEYVSNNGKNKINFSSALEIIEEIGSPNEIIQNLYISIPETNQALIFCPHCHFKNLKNSTYCEYCGKEIKSDINSNLKESESERDPIIKKIIYMLQLWVDNPFPVGFIYFSIATSIFISFIIFSGNYSFLSQRNSFFNNIYNAFAFILLISTIVGILLSFIFGIAINLGFSEFKTIRQQNDRIICKYDNRIVSGLVIVFIAINTFLPSIHAPESGLYSIDLLLFRLNYSPRILILLIWLIVYILAIYYFLVYYNYANKPYEANIAKLKITDLHSQRSFVSDLVRINMKTLIPVLIFAFLSTILLSGVISNNSFFSYIIQNFILSLLILNGFLIMKLNSWKNLLNYPVKQV